jgi:hypothetical protein
MRVARLVLSSLLIFVSSATLSSQQSTSAPQRDPQATALLQASVRAMGGSVPSDSVATGSVDVVAGSLTTSGTVRILTRGTDQTLEQLSLPQSTVATIYSRGAANATRDGTTQSLSLERTASCQSAAFPLPFLAAALANPDEAIQYVALETSGQPQLQHIRVWNTYNSNSAFQFLSDFTTTDIWLVASSGLPKSISFTRRDGGGASPKTLLTVSYSTFQRTGAILYPNSIHISINGTPWATTTIQSVSLNTGLTDADFPVTQVGAN